MAKFEYQHVFTDEYEIYSKKAKLLLTDISAELDKKIIDLNYLDIINFFHSRYNIHFSFFEADPSEFIEDPWEEIVPDKTWINHKNQNLLPNADFVFLDYDIVKRVSGVTIPNGKRTLILINQDRVIQRIIFTVLHELCHFYFHIRDENKKQIFVSLTNDQIEGKYSKELIPFENEANIIGSLLFCPTEKLEYMLIQNYSFSKMAHEVGMSESAMHNRLLNYIEHVQKTNEHLALKYVLKFRYDEPTIDQRIKYNIEMNRRELKLTNEEKALVKMQAAYIDKLGTNTFWSEIFTDIGWVSEDDSDTEYPLD
ncbi:ImmA/IrrE family metallo-endopeptidase [Enterococcus songbeiensis]